MPVKRQWFSHKKRIAHRSASRLDFSWEESTPNPYVHRAPPAKPQKHRTIQLVVAALAIGGASLILLLHPLFQIRQENIKIVGLKQVSSTDFTNAVLGILGNPMIKFLPRNNYLLLNTDELCDILKHRFPVLSVTTTKIFPNSLTITVVEKPPVILFDNGYTYATVGINGEVVDLLRAVSPNEWEGNHMPTITTSSIFSSSTNDLLIDVHHPNFTDLKPQYPNYPVVFQPAPRPLHTNLNVLSATTVQQILSWNQTLTENLQIPVQYISLLSSNDDADIMTGEGWHIRVHLGQDVPEQLRNLNMTLHEKSFPRPHVHYLDLRFKTHIFWQ